MSQLSDYRTRIANLLAADDIEQTLVDEGVSSILARRIAISAGVVASRSKEAVGDSVENADHSSGE